jgi:Domain of unknown function DUF29
MGEVPLYDRDFYAWANQQASLLRAGRLSEADLDHIAEEIESMGKAEKRELVSRLTVLLLHLLKWRYQPERRGNSWRNTIKIQRITVASLLADNPSLKPVLNQAIEEAYRVAVLEAENETGMAEETFPPACPWPFAQTMDAEFWPGSGE